MIGIYTRVSTVDQAGEDKYSIPQQKEEGIAFSTSKGSDYIIYEDHKSGGDITREGWVKLFNDVESGKISTIWVGKIDRFSRNTESGLNAIGVMRKCKTKFYVGGIEYDIFNEETYLLITMQFAFAQYEKMSIKSRTMKGRKKSRDAGNYRINNTLGYINAWDESGKAIIKVDEEEAKTVRYIFKMYVEERLTYNQIVERLNTEGYKCKKRGMTYKYKNGTSRVVGEYWSIGSFIQALKRPEYIGMILDSDKTLIKSNYFPAIVDEKIWYEAQIIRVNRREKLTVKGYKVTNHELSGIIVCSKCGGKYYYRSYDKKVRREKGHFYYAHKVQTQTHKECTLQPKMIKAKELEEIFMIIYFNTFTNSDELKKLHEMHLNSIKKDSDEIKEDKERISKLITEIDKKLSNFITVIENGIQLDGISERIKELMKMKTELKENLRKKELDFQLKSSTWEHIFNKYTVDSLKEYLEANPAKKRDIYIDVFESCLINENGDISIKFREGREVHFNSINIPIWLKAQLISLRSGLYTPEWINKQREVYSKMDTFKNLT